MAKNINLEMQLWKTEEEQINAIKATVNSFRFIRNPSKKVQLFVVKKKDGSFIKYIKNPSEEIQLEAVKQNGYAIQCIKNPSEKIIRFVLENNIDINFLLRNISINWNKVPEDLILLTKLYEK